MINGGWHCTIWLTLSDTHTHTGTLCLSHTHTHTQAHFTSHTNKGTDQIGRLGGSEIWEGKTAKQWHAAWRRDRLNKMTHLVILCQRLHQSFWGKATTIILGHPFTFSDGNHGNKQPLTNLVRVGNQWRLRKRHVAQLLLAESQNWKSWHTCC